MSSETAPKKERLACGRLICCNAGTQTCAACRRIDYCSVDCQKADWTVHKSYCSKQVNRRFDLEQVKRCPRQAEAISRYLDYAEDYLSRDPELATRLRVSTPFLAFILSLQNTMRSLYSEERSTMQALCRRLKNILERAAEVVDSGRIWDEVKDNDFSDRFRHVYLSFTAVQVDYFDLEEGLKIYQEAMSVAYSFNDVAKRIDAIVDISLRLSLKYQVADDLAKATEVLEQAYLLRSEHVGPDDVQLQTVTLQLCQLLGSMKEYDRMLEYIQVAIDNIRSHSADSVISYLTPISYALFRCAHSLPEDHSQRTKTFAQAAELAVESFMAEIKYPKASREGKRINIISSIPDDVDLDHNKFARLLAHIFDIYLEKHELILVLDTVKNITEILRHLSARLQSGLTLSSTVDWKLIAIDIRLKLKRAAAGTQGIDPALARWFVGLTDSAGAFTEATIAKKAVIMSETHAFIERSTPIYDALYKLSPYVRSSKIVTGSTGDTDTSKF